MKRLNTDRAFWTFIEVSREVIALAETVVAAHPLRTLDALHVASAQLFNARMGIDGLTFVSSDRRPTEAAIALGMATVVIA